MTDQAAYDVIIVGGASAGLTAAIYTSRQELQTLVITKDIGGQALLTDEIQNYPGFMSISGFELMTKFQEQAAAYGAKFLYDEVRSISKDSDGFTVKTTAESYHAIAVILAFGKTPRDLGVSGEERLKGRGVSYCAVCDGPLFKGKKVAVAGAGDQAYEAVSYLSNVVSQIVLVHKPPKLTAGGGEVQHLIDSGKVVFYPASEIVSINGDKKVESIEIKSGGRSIEESVEGLFVEIGYIARSEFIKGLVETNSKGEIISSMDGKTSTEGIFACGDITQIPYKQAVISAGMGATAALSAYNYVMSRKGMTASRSDWKSIKIKDGDTQNLKL
ncbi:MAG: FAD-dependent oxidoreductase [Candidatus Thermoplasmatota archaeon]|nr:FAD-dependent oxidoreductase [Candidatus Thermoplasmatota archaeon]MCL5731392.1 FAD-dependent oxidoreductase [Candidatus Thermoplasmatota archaeon]